MPKLEVVNANNVIEFNPQKANFKLKNTGGPKGDTGAQGPQGPKGETGAQGPAGASASVTVGSTTTLSPGADATVTNSGDTRNAILNFGIPTGARGPKGDTGSKGDTGPIGPKGAKGDTGAAATVQVGNTNTGAPGTNAQVTNAGNEHFAVFNFTIPRGDKGNTGATGPQGPQGPAGQNGADGFSPIATVTQEGLDAEISITDKNGTTTATVPGFGVQTVATLPATGTENVIYLKRTESTASGKSISISDAVEAPLSDFKLKGETSQNGTPTPDSPVPVQTVTGENVVKINGKNLADIPDFSVAGSGYAIGASNGAVSVDSTTTNRAISLCSGADGGAWLPAYTSSSVIDHHITGNGGSYTISLANVAKTITGTQAFYVSVYTNKRSVANTTLTSSSNFAPSTITLDSDEHIKDIWIWVGRNTTYNVSFNIQLELGSSASSFEPYKGQSYTISLGSIELCKIGDYQDYIYKSGGKWYVRKEVGKFAFPNTGWLLRADSPVKDGSVFRYSGYVAGEFATGSQGISSHLKVVSSGNVLNTMRFIDANNYGYNVCIENTAVGITSDDSNYEKQNKFATWCGSNNPVCYYIKTTPTDTEITNDALIEQLEAILSAGQTYAGTTNITTVIATGNEQGTLEVGYYNAYDSYLYVAGRWQQFARLTAANE